MANILSTQIINDGPRNVQVKFVANLDSGNLSNVVLLDPATLAIPDLSTNLRAKSLTFKSVKYQISNGIYVNLLWEGTPNALLLALVGYDEINQQDKGLIPSNAVSPTGRVLLSTVGLTVGPLAAITLIATFVKNW
ncbi:MAG: hypothetical protein K2Q97_02560 [Burkholderiaceae bacterium]|nr:hypothetical protein [Burkholderiaceae bacterium]